MGRRHAAFAHARVLSRRLLARDDLNRALRDVAAGRGVRRADHRLIADDGEDVTGPFIEALTREGYAPTTVAATETAEDERVPAWLLDGATARFGYVFWERFTPQRARKLWGSVHKNATGDWDRVLGRGSRQLIYANPAQRERIDPNNPSGW